MMKNTSMESKGSVGKLEEAKLRGNKGREEVKENEMNGIEAEERGEE